MPGELGRAARTSAMSHPLCALAPLQQPLRPGAPTAWGLLFILAQKLFRGCGGWGEGQLLSLRQKDAGQHFIRNHLNVFAVFRIRALVGWVGCLGSGVRRFHLSSRLHVSVGRGCGASRQLLWELMTTSPDHLGAHSEGLSRSLCLERSVR